MLKLLHLLNERDYLHDMVRFARQKQDNPKLSKLFVLLHAGHIVNVPKAIKLVIKKCPNGREGRKTQTGAFSLPLRLSTCFARFSKCTTNVRVASDLAQPRPASPSLTGPQPNPQSKSVQMVGGPPKYYYILLKCLPVVYQ